MPRVLPALTVALGLTAAGCLVYAWQLHNQLGASAAEAATKAKELARLQAQVVTLEHEALRPAEAPAPDIVDPANLPPRPAAPDTGRPGAARAEAFAAFRNSPEAQRLMAVQRRAMLDGRYAALFRKLNLSPADLEKFKSLLVDKQSAAMDVMAAAREQGLNPRDNREQIGELIRNFEAETDASIRTTLGEAAFQQYQQYEQTAPQRNMVGQIEQRLSYSSTPLYGNQSEQLVNLLASTSPASARSTPATPALLGAAGGNRGVTITDAVITQSEGFLSPPQVEALRQLQQEQAAAAALRQQMQQARRASNGAGTPATPAAGTGP